MNPPIIVVVSGGVVQSVENIPAGWTVQVRDYDTDGAPADETETDENGDQYTLADYLG